MKKVNKFRLESGHKVREGRGGVYFSKSKKIYMPPLREGVGYMGSKQNQLEKGKGHQKWGGVYKITAQEGGIICWRFYDQSLIKQQGVAFPPCHLGGGKNIVSISKIDRGGFKIPSDQGEGDFCFSVKN